jgi:hypothetical protein
MENDLNNRRTTLNTILQNKPPLTIDVELANRPLMKDEAVQFEDINSGKKISNNKLPIPP